MNDELMTTGSFNLFPLVFSASACRGGAAGLLSAALHGALPGGRGRPNARERARRLLAPVQRTQRAAAPRSSPSASRLGCLSVSVSRQCPCGRRRTAPDFSSGVGGWRYGGGDVGGQVRAVRAHALDGRDFPRAASSRTRADAHLRSRCRPNGDLSTESSVACAFATL